MFVVNDLLDKLLLGSFFFGLIFSALTLVLGVADLGIDHPGHDPGFGHHDFSAGHDVLPPLNLSTMLAFLTWFGGIAYLVRNGLGWVALVSLPIGVIGGWVGAYFIYRALKKLRAGEREMSAESERIEGTIARVTSSIRAGGVGEIVYKLGDSWQVAAARTNDGVAIPRDTQVVITGRVGGISTVETWESFLGDEYADLVPIADDVPGSQPSNQIKVDR
jgi:membrane protein implicated in regulation of membrane protease activity